MKADREEMEGVNDERSLAFSKISRTLPGDALTGNGMKYKNIRDKHKLHTTS